MYQQQAGQPPWAWSQSHQQYYYYDHISNQYVFWNGMRLDVPRPMIAETNEASHRPISQGRTSWPNYAQPYTPACDPAHNSNTPYNSYTTSPSRRQTSFGSSAGDPSNDLPTSGLSTLHLRDDNQRRRQRVAFEQVSEAYDPNTQVRTRFLTEPKEKITDQELLKEGGIAHRMVLPDDEEVPLDHRFKVRDKPSKFFIIGRVFLILWAEPARESNETGVSLPTMVSGTLVGSGRYGQPVHQKVRRFVVVREGEQFCTALPIGTYNGKGVAKDRVKKSDHAIIFSTKTPPKPLGRELPGRGEEAMRPQSIRVVPDVRDEKLDPMSRIDFGKPHTIHHNLKVRAFGMVGEKSTNDLLNQFKAVLLDGLFSRRQAGLVRRDSAGRYDRSNAMQRSNVRYQGQVEAGAQRPTGLRQREVGEGDSSGGEDDDSGGDEEDE